MRRLGFSSIYFAAALAGTLVLGSCDSGGGGPAATVCGSGFDAEAGTVGDFGTDEAALKVEAFLRATAALYTASVDLEADVRGACTAIATDLGIPAAELEPTGTELAVTAACGRVKTEIDAIVATLPTGFSLGVVVSPAECQIDLDLAASCAAECDVTIEGDATVECSGELHGACSGTCTGHCSVEGSASCTGACSATCTGECDGTCTGECVGSCPELDSQKNCAGTCTGECRGTCEGTCSGTCDGTCTSDVTASCAGECHGTCDVAWEAECNGEANVTANADCQAACEAQANASATCTEPQVTITGVAVGDPAAAARLETLITSLEAHYPALLQAQARLQYSLAPSLDAFVASLDGAANAVVAAGAQAVACMAIAVDAAADAAARIDASVSVSVEVSASVSASGSAGASP